jgi:hypothetical protein
MARCVIGLNAACASLFGAATVLRNAWSGSVAVSTSEPLIRTVGVRAPAIRIGDADSVESTGITLGAGVIAGIGKNCSAVVRQYMGGTASSRE